MKSYTYTPLVEEGVDIRICTVLPGRFEDDICIRVTHEALPAATRKSPRPRMSPEEITRTLPEGWRARVAMDGRFVFQQDSTYPGRNEGYTSWYHPDYRVPREAYQLPPDEEEERHHQGTEPYEALSYTWGNPEAVARVLVQPQPRGTERLHDDNQVSSIGVTANLAEALRYLRHEDRPRRL